MATLKVPEFVPSPTEDSEGIRKAFEGAGTDEEAIIWILGHRKASQRTAIREAYQQLYNESLLDRLHSELSGDFRNAVILWMTDPAERDAKLAKNALSVMWKGMKQLQVLVEIACASSPHHLIAVRKAYCSLYDCSLEEDIELSVSQPIKKVLVGLVSTYRYDKENLDSSIASSEAEKLHEAIQSKQLDQDDIIWLLCTRNFYQLRATFAFYRQSFGNPIEQDIRDCGNGDLGALVRVIVMCIDAPEKHFAEVVRDSIIGLGTDEESLNRAIISRAEIDMAKITMEYTNLDSSTFEEAVIGDSSGDYKNFLLTLLGSRM